MGGRLGSPKRRNGGGALTNPDVLLVYAAGRCPCLITDKKTAGGSSTIRKLVFADEELLEYSSILALDRLVLSTGP